LNEAVGVFTPDNQKIITIAKDFTVRLWSATDGALSDTVNIASSNAFGQDPIFSDDAKRIIIPLENGQAYIGTFDKEYSKLPSFSNPVTLEKAYAFLANDGQVKPLNIPLANVTSGALIEATKEIFVGTSEGTAAIFDLSTGEIKSDYIRHDGVLVELAATTDGNTLATASSFGSIMIWTGKI
jgi:WD40 repeat protein